MNRATKRLLLSLLTLSAVSVILLPVLNGAQVGKQRGVKLVEIKDQPVEIVNVKVKGAEVKPKIKFAGEDDWLVGMTLALKNVSDRPVAFVSVLVSAYFERDGVRTKKRNGRDVQAAVHLIYGGQPPRPGEVVPPSRPPIPPGQTVEVVLTERERQELSELLAKDGAETDVTEINIMLYEVFFEGDSDTMWSTGFTLRRDPNDPQRWWPVEGNGAAKRAGKKPRFERARFTPPARVPFYFDPDAEPCSYRPLGVRNEDCTAVFYAAL